MGKKIKQHFYSTNKIVYKNHKFIEVRNENETLFADGVYPTKITKDDLPEWYCPVTIRRRNGFLSAKGVVHLLYQPNYVFNHMFKDDFLYISYNQPIVKVPREESIYRCVGFNEVICGGNIVRFVKAAEKYSGYDITQIKEEIERKRVWFKESYPEFYALEVPYDGVYLDYLNGEIRLD